MVQRGEHLSLRSNRALLRHRDTLVKSAGTYVQRMQKALIEMNLLLPRVVSDIGGRTGLRILRALVAGERDPHVLAQHRLGRSDWSALCADSGILVLHQRKHLTSEALCAWLRSRASTSGKLLSAPIPPSPILAVTLVRVAQRVALAKREAHFKFSAEKAHLLEESLEAGVGPPTGWLPRSVDPARRERTPGGR